MNESIKLAFAKMWDYMTLALNNKVDKDTLTSNYLTKEEIETYVKNLLTTPPATCQILFNNMSPSSLTITYYKVNENNEIERSTITQLSYHAGYLTVACNTYFTIKVDSGVYQSEATFDSSLAKSKLDSGYYEFYLPADTTTEQTVTINWTDCCFVPGTQILTSLNGDTVSIEDLKKGDSVVSYNVDTGENYMALVRSLIINHNTTDIAELHFDNGTILTMNAYHPVYTSNGFHSITNHNGYETLEIGDLVRTVDGWIEIIDIIRYNSEPIVTYNLDVIDKDETIDIGDKDTFFANGVVVHNASCPS